MEFVEFLENFKIVFTLLFSRALLCVKVYRRKGGQRGYSGHTISIYQDVQKLATALPRLPNEVESFIVVKPGQRVQNKKFKVRRKVVQRWLA